MKFQYHVVAIVLVCALSEFFCCDTAAGFQEPEISIAGFSIALKDETSEYGGSIAGSLQPGTMIYINAHLPGRTVIKIKRKDGTKIDVTDSTGKSLPDTGANFSFMPEISDDGETVQLPVASQETPEKGADSIKVKGSVILVCGANQKTEEIEVEIASGKKLNFAGIEFEVTNIDDSFMNDDGQTFELQSTKSPDQIKSIEGVLANGKTVEFDSTGRSEFGFGNSVTYGRNFDVKCKAADIKKIKVTYFQEVEEIELAFDLKVGLGL